jgi:transposase
MRSIGAWNHCEFITKQRSSQASWLDIKQLIEPRIYYGELTSTRLIPAMNTKNYIAIDISKRTLQVCSNSFSDSFPYSDPGLKELIEKIKSIDSPIVVYEATGGYERKLAEALHQCAIAACMVNPARVRAFAKSDGIKAKTDPIDAALILRFAIEKKLTPTKPLTEKQLTLQALMDRRSQLTEVITSEKNRLDKAPKIIRKSIEKIIRLLEKELQAIDQSIRDLIAQDALMSEKQKIMREVVGVGEITCWTFFAYLSEITQLNRNQLVALVGLAPYNRDSGLFKGKRKIEGGRAKIRKCLYMAATSAAVHNKHIKPYVDALRARGKPYKCAIVAAMRKLLIHLQNLLKKSEIALA